jgi:phosphotransferase system IIB component
MYFQTKSQIYQMSNVFSNQISNLPNVKCIFKPNLKSTKCQMYFQNQISNLPNVKCIFKTKSQIYQMSNVFSNQISNLPNVKCIFKTKSQIYQMSNVFSKPNLKSIKCQIYQKCIITKCKIFQITTNCIHQMPNGKNVQLPNAKYVK